MHKDDTIRMTIVVVSVITILMVIKPETLIVLYNDKVYLNKNNFLKATWQSSTKIRSGYWKGKS